MLFAERLHAFLSRGRKDWLGETRGRCLIALSVSTIQKCFNHPVSHFYLGVNSLTIVFVHLNFHIRRNFGSYHYVRVRK